MPHAFGCRPISTGPECRFGSYLAAPRRRRDLISSAKCATLPFSGTFRRRFEMTVRLRAIGWFLALSAILLRAALPDGWMVADRPDGSAFVICTGHGPLAPPAHSRKQIPARGPSNEVCPFAAGAHLSPPALLALIPEPIWRGKKAEPGEYWRTIYLSRPPHSNHVPRAPPFLV